MLLFMFSFKLFRLKLIKTEPKGILFFRCLGAVSEGVGQFHMKEVEVDVTR